MKTRRVQISFGSPTISMGAVVSVADGRRINFGPVYAVPVSVSSGHYEHTQSFAAQQWNVVHNLGRHTPVTVVDLAGRELQPRVTHVSINEVIISFSGPQSGFAYL